MERRRFCSPIKANFFLFYSFLLSFFKKNKVSPPPIFLSILPLAGVGLIGDWPRNHHGWWPALRKTAFLVPVSELVRRLSLLNPRDRETRVPSPRLSPIPTMEEGSPTTGMRADSGLLGVNEVRFCRFGAMSAEELRVVKPRALCTSRAPHGWCGALAARVSFFLLL
ncbi:hypothetical protein EPI10_010733 [Gossypium australe]|uniref:Uncharacterized protein n=1 Tax=Gossypium australe TaxID=47621 RepID=A0A5B6W6R4_9ROSI|nr:hypothetical protein EPI10_010733 [Gossypium australe]